MFPEENQQQVDAFLARQADARQLPLAGDWVTLGQLLVNDQHDGFYYALLEKM
ncbi:MAG: hypothetical protein ABL868_11705 [Sulfuriferula sp.]